jgi:hypothetical protein
MVELAGDSARVEVLGRAARAIALGLSWDGAARATEEHLNAIINGSALR